MKITCTVEVPAGDTTLYRVAADTVVTDDDGRAVRDAVEDELGMVVAFIEEMPTWCQSSVVAVRDWLVEQLHAGHHRR